MRKLGKTGIAVWILAAGFATAQFMVKPIAVVNGEAVPRSELDAILKIRPTAVTPLTASQRRQMYEQVIMLLVDETLIRQFLAKNAPPAEPAAVEKQFNELLAGLKAQNKSLADFCRENQQTEKQVRSGIENMIRWQAYVASKITDAELQKYYVENKDYFDRVRVRCSHIVYRAPADAPAAERAEAEKKLRELRGQILAGKISFADAARDYSHCPSASKGGDLGFIQRKWMVEEPFARAAFAMKPGELSDVVTTDFGFHLILVTDRKAGVPTDFAKIKQEVRDCYGEELRLKLIDDLRRSAKVVINVPEK